MKLSVLLPVYARESPEFLQESLESVAAQTRPAEEVVIVADGPMTERLDAVIDSFCARLPLVVVRLRENLGLGAALHVGLEQCRGEYVARMDADDVCLPQRFARQLEFLKLSPHVDVAGSAIAEFNEHPGAVYAVRRLPVEGDALRSFAKYRNPLNHVTVTFRRKAVLEAGSYQPCAGFEDYHLWMRMLRRGHCLHNLPEVLVYVRCGSGMQQRRGGLTYFRRELAFQRFLYRTGLTAASDCARNILLRAPLRIAPEFLRAFCYERFLRDPVPRKGELNFE
jgi:glycosyltransferase involved in cell wall biosynthesis